MAAVVDAVRRVEELVGQPPVIVGGLAVLCRLSTAYRATTDLDVVDRGTGEVRHLELVRRAEGSRDDGPVGVVIPTRFGEVRVDVLEVRQIELDEPSDDAGDRLHAASHAWASDTASPVEIVVLHPDQSTSRVLAPIAEPGPIVAMKLQAVMDRSAEKQGTDLQDIVRIVLDRDLRHDCLEQIRGCPVAMAQDITTHIEHWFGNRRTETLRAIRATGGTDISGDDLDLVAELLTEAAERGSMGAET